MSIPSPSSPIVAGCEIRFLTHLRKGLLLGGLNLLFLRTKSDILLYGCYGSGLVQQSPKFRWAQCQWRICRCNLKARRLDYWLPTSCSFSLLGANFRFSAVAFSFSRMWAFLSLCLPSLFCLFIYFFVVLWVPSLGAWTLWSTSFRNTLHQLWKKKNSINIKARIHWAHIWKRLLKYNVL